MKREPRLRRVERVGQLADATLAVPEPVEDPEAGLVGEGVEDACGVFLVGGGSGCHEGQDINII